MVKAAQKISEEFNFQSMAYDFIYDHDKNPKIVEMSYNYAFIAIDKALGIFKGLLPKLSEEASIFGKFPYNC